jgi:hypothetical protein
MLNMRSLDRGSGVMKTGAWFPVKGPVAKASTRVYGMLVEDMILWQQRNRTEGSLGSKYPRSLSHDA